MKTNIPHNAHEIIFKNEHFKNNVFKDYTFTNCIFDGCDFTDSSFEGAAFWQCTFKKCNLSLVKLTDCRLVDIVFEESKLIGLDFSSCDTSLLFSISARQSILHYCNFSGLAMEHALFKECKVIACIFKEVNLRNASIESTDLAGSIFHMCDLRKSNFNDAKNYIINPCENKIKNAQFSFPDCIGLLKAMDITIVE